MDGLDCIDDAGRKPDLTVLLAAVEASGEAILITSAELEEPGPRIEYTNPAFTRMTGYESRGPGPHAAPASGDHTLFRSGAA